MSVTDAELYLRLLSERELLKPSRSGGGRGSDDPLLSVIDTLLAAGAIDPEVARRVIQDDSLVHDVRGETYRAHHRQVHRRARSYRALEARRAAALGQTIELADGTVTLHEILIGRKRSTLRYTWVRGGANRRSRGRLRRRHGGPHGQAMWGSSPISIIDGAGNRPTVHSGGGGGSDDSWEGELILDGRLDPTTPWIELDGVRLELDRATALLSVTVEPLEEQTPLERHLWRSLARMERPFGHRRDPGPSLDALAALGLLDADGPLATSLRAVAHAMPEHWHHGHMGSPGTHSTRGLPEPWRSLLRRGGRSNGLERNLLIGARTPAFDGVQVAVHTVTTDEGGFEALTEMTPDLFGGTPIGTSPIVWWARDDRGNHYLGSPSNWSGGQGHAEGTLSYWPSIDPKATRLDLMPTAAEHRAVIAISLEQPIVSEGR